MGGRHPQYELHVYAALLLLVGCSHIVAVLLIRTISDRRPQPANLLFAGKGNARLHYAALPFWGYIAFFVLWSGGRSSLIGFTTAYLLSLNYSMTGISMLLAIQFVISGLMLLVLGRVTDRFGSRRPLIAVSGVIACCMFLWVASAWFGLAPDYSLHDRQRRRRSCAFDAGDQLRTGDFSIPRPGRLFRDEPGW